MLKKGLFKRPKNELETYNIPTPVLEPCVPDEICISCKACKTTLFANTLHDNFYICSKCGKYFSVSARKRIAMIADLDSFAEIDKDLTSTNIIDFPDYDKKLKNAKAQSGENEGVLCGTATIGGNACAIFAMEPCFMMGSMGTVVGEKITRLFELATKQSLPVIGFTVSGGARMQEGILSLMQMAKISGAVKRHNDSGNLYITVLADPTTGGVTASFAMEGDIILAEPGALICFAGPRVIEQTIRQKLPKGFQTAEFLLTKGFVDSIVQRPKQKETLSKLLELHRKQPITQ